MAFLEAADDVCDEKPRRAPTSHTRAAMDDLSPLQRDRLCYRPILPDCLAKETRLFHFACDYRVKGERAPHELLPGPVLGKDDRAAHGSYRACGGAVDADAADDDLASRSHATDIERRFPLTSRAPVCRLVAVGGGTSPPGSDLAATSRTERARCRSAARLGLVFSGGPAPGGNNVAWGMLDCLERWAAESGRGDDAEPANFVGFLGGPDGLLRRRWKRVDAGEMKRRKNQGGFDLLGSGRTRLNTTAHFDALRDACVEANLDGLVVCGGDDR